MHYLTEQEIVIQKSRALEEDFKGYLKADVEDIDSKRVLIPERVEDLSDSHERLSMEVGLIYNGLVSHLKDKEVHLPMASPTTRSEKAQK
jgi:hypothetical protein